MKKFLLSTSCVLALILTSGIVKAEDENKNNDMVSVEQVVDIVSDSNISNEDISEKKEPIIVKNLAVVNEDIWEGIEIVKVDTENVMKVRNDNTISPEDKIKILKELRIAEEARLIKAYDDQRNNFLNRIYELKDKGEDTDEVKAEIRKIQKKINLINDREDGALMEIEKYFN